MTKTNSARAKPRKRKFNYGAKGVGIILGHQTCVPRGRGTVPREMGWLWTADQPGYRFDPHWRPGAVPRGVFQLRRRTEHELARVPDGKTQRSKRKAPDSGASASVHSTDSLPHALVVKRKDGNIHVVLQQLPKPKDRHVSEYPYDDDALPITITVPEETEQEQQRRKRAAARRAADRTRELCQQSLWNICREVHRKIDKNALREVAADNDACSCLYLETQIVSNLVDMYLGHARGENSACGYDKEHAFLDKLMNAVLEERKKTKSCPSDETPSSSDEEWLIEFTPPCALYDPHAKRHTTRNAEAQTKRIEGDSEGRGKSSVTLPTIKDSD